MIAESSRIAPDLFTMTGSMDELDPENSPQQSTISFCIQLFPETPQRAAKWKGPKKHSLYEIELPLANTIFRNGLTSTMLASRWTRSGSSTPVKFEMSERRALRHQRILMPTRACPPASTRQLIDVPLERLTIPRIIASAMGNIVRQLYTDTTASGIMPASEGLETAVHRFLKRKGTSPPSQSLAVWALVTPKERWHGEPTAQDTTIFQKFQNGSRLHRVLSGGGGYGKKMGLLALDPDTAYESGSKPSAFGTGEDLDQEEKDALGQVAKPGDVIQFFVYTPGLAAGITKQGRKELNFAHIAFGTIPSTIDSMPNSSTETEKADGVPPVNYRTDMFGALSELGLGLTIDSHGPRGMEFLGAESLGRVVQSKIDVPFTTVQVRLRPQSVKAPKVVSRTATDLTR